MKRREIKVQVWFEGNHPVILQRDGWAEPVEELVERWDVRGRWWARDTRRHYMTLRTGRGTFEVCGDARSGHWVITGTYD